MHLIKDIIKIRMFSLLFILATMGCTDIGDTVHEWTNPRHLVPVVMRHQPYNNLPNSSQSNPSVYLESRVLPDVKPIRDKRIIGYQNGQPVVKDQKDNVSYNEGFEDGCRNSNGIIGAGTLRLRSPKIDGKRLTTDQWYLRGYQDAVNYCVFYLDWETH